MPKRYLYIALTAAALVAAAGVVYAQQISGKGAGSVINVAAFDRITDQINVDLDAFLACSKQGLMLKNSDCVLVPAPESEWVTVEELRWQNPSEAPDTEIPDPLVWGSPANLRGPQGECGDYVYTDSGTTKSHCN